MEKFINIYPHEKCGHRSVLSQNLFCYSLQFFVAKYVLSRFTRFGVEKDLTKICACGEKRTNIRYALKLDLLYEIKLKLILESIL